MKKPKNCKFGLKKVKVAILAVTWSEPLLPCYCHPKRPIEQSATTFRNMPLQAKERI